jgi:hypothetical protein
VPLEGKSPLFGWHIAIATMAYSTLTIAAFHAVLMALQEARLHARRQQILPVRRAGSVAGAADHGKAVVPHDRLRLRPAEPDRVVGHRVLGTAVRSGAEMGP